MKYEDLLKTLDGCPFCKLKKNEIVKENKSCFIILNRNPYIKDHFLIIPKKHVSRLFSLNKKEKTDLFDLIFWAQKKAGDLFSDFSLLYREGKGVGKSVSHAHVHIIPKLKLKAVSDGTKNREVMESKVYIAKTREMKERLKNSRKKL